MKRNLVVSALGILFVGMISGATATAQTKAYRQVGLASDAPELASTVDPQMKNSWGITFLPGQPFFISNDGSGSITVHDTTGVSAGAGFIVPDLAGTGPGTPTGIVADVNSEFAGRNFVQPFIVVTDDGRVFEWGPDARGDIPQQPTLVFDSSPAGAVYKGMTILHSPSSAPAVAVTDFHGGFIQTFLPGFAPVALAGSFSDPNLPAGYAPFGIQVIGSQVVVTYAVQDIAKHDPVIGAGNGIVSIFGMDGNFLKRFATGGPLNAPLGVTQASANFGPFSNAILIGNVGDGIINAFDPGTGNFLGALKDGDGIAITDLSLHALTFRSDSFGDPNTLYLTAEIGGGAFGLFGAITPGLVTTTNVSVQTTASTGVEMFTATVAPAPGNTGVPTCTVDFTDDGNELQTVALINGVASFSVTLSGEFQHSIRVRYSGDATFLTSRTETNVQVGAIPTTLMLDAPVSAVSGSSVNLMASVSESGGGIPTGQIVFQDGSTILGTVPLNATGTATLTLSTLTLGAHSVSATYAGDGTFGGSTSSVVNISITAQNADFALSATPPNATVMAGQSTQFVLTVAPSNGFTKSVTFSCPVIAGITCVFSPAAVTPTNGTASTTLTVATSADVTRYAIPLLRQIAPVIWLAALGLLVVAVWHGRKLQIARASLFATAWVLAMFSLSVALGGCGGYSNSGTSTNRGTASIIVTAQSGTLSHNTTVSVTVQ